MSGLEMFDNRKLPTVAASEALMAKDVEAAERFARREPDADALLGYLFGRSS